MRFRISTINRIQALLFIAILVAIQVWILKSVLQYTDIGQIIPGIVMIIVMALPIFGLLRTRRMLFSWVYIGTMGITNKCFFCEDIFIAWDDCAEIGIGKIISYSKPHHGSMGRYSCFIPDRLESVYKYCIYFSKETMTDAQINYMQVVRLSPGFLRVQFSKKAWAEVLKYIDTGDIRGGDNVNSKSHRMQFKRR